MRDKCYAIVNGKRENLFKNGGKIAYLLLAINTVCVTMHEEDFLFCPRPNGELE
jgi:hypothetical protein